MPLIAVNLGGEGVEFLPLTAVKATARWSPVLSLKNPGVINGACTMDGMVGEWKQQKQQTEQMAAFVQRSEGGSELV